MPNILAIPIVVLAGGFAVAGIVCFAASLVDILLGRVVVLEWLTGTTARWVTLLVASGLAVLAYWLVAGP